MNKINIGKIVNVVGLKGELKVYHYTDYKERFGELSTVFIENKEYKIEKVRYLKDLVILKLEGIDHIDQAETYRDKLVDIDEKNMRELPSDTYYIRELIGISVVDEHGMELGKLSNVFQNSAQDTYEITQENQKKFLVPAVSEFILNIDMEQGNMTIKVIDGLMDL